MGVSAVMITGLTAPMLIPSRVPRFTMLLTLLLFAHLMTRHVTPSVMASHRPAVASHASHVRHERHLQHLHWLHVRHAMKLQHPSFRATSPSQPPPAYVSARYSGRLSCSGMEALWRSAGGSPSAAFVAASIAMAESGGNEYATGPDGERGYWQIHPDHGALSTYDPFGNARAAIIISDDGRDWSAWTTYTSGAYLGRCLPVYGACGVNWRNGQ